MINKKIILASKSPRRQHLLKEMGFDFEVKIKDVPEDYPSKLKREKVALYLSELKADAFDEELDDDTIVITSDTIVCIENEVINKPKDYNDAVCMLKKISGNKHTVFTGVCLKSNKKKKSFYSSTDVYFRELTLSEIEHYIKTYEPYDKAGAYGIQEWIGYIGINRIEGSFYNVMGLPTSKLYHELLDFIK